MQHALLLVTLAAIWGGSYIFIRVAAPVLGPAVLMESRVVLAFLVLGGYTRSRGISLDLRRNWRRFLVLGTVSGAVPFALIATGELALPAYLASILNATTPLFSAVVAAIWLGEAVTRSRVIGLGVGLLGVGLLVGWSPLALNGRTAFAIAISLAAAASYAIGGTYAGRAFSGVPPVLMATGQQLGAAIVLAPFAAISLPAAHATWTACANLLALALLSTGLAYMLYYPLLKAVGPTRTLSVTFLIPFFGVLWGALFLREVIGWGTILGLLVILAGVFLIARGPVGSRPHPHPRVPSAGSLAE